MKKIFISCLIFSSITTFAQQSQCGFDELRKIFLNTSSSYKEKEDKNNQSLYHQAINHTHNKGSQTVLQIPTVVHVIHQFGPENISDSVVLAAINQLNLRYQNATPYYDSTGNDMQIQFCLASVDPQGNPTTGITRNVSSLTVLNASNDMQMKDLNRWDPYYYFNIWTVDQIHGFNISVAGYATMPTNVGDSYDGVVTLAGSLNSTVLAHEAGHYLGLYHTWNYWSSFPDCSNYNCLLDGDLVCDTPPDTSRSGCMDNSCSSDMDDTTGFSAFTSDVNELPNYMDYNTCPLSFSQGQADRMTNVINSIRYLLLQSAGCGFAGGIAPLAQISYTISPCNNGVVSFSDSLSTNINTVNWDFDNDGVYDSYIKNPVFTFPATGTYTVKLLVAGQGGVDSTFQTIFVQKAPSLYYPITTLSGIFPNPNGGWNSCGNFTNSYTSAPAQSYLWSTGDTTQSISFIPDSNFTLTLTIVDSAGLTWNNALCNPLIVNVNPLPPLPFIYSNDSLTICDGDSVLLQSIVSGNGIYTYNWYENGGGGTGVNDSVFIAVGFSPGVSYQLIISDTNGCYNYSNYLYVNSYSPPLMQSLTQNNLQLTSGWGSGNQWYFNGVPIPGATGTIYDVTQIGCYSVAWFFSFAPQCSTMSDTICFTSVGVNEINTKNYLATVYPVPATNFIKLKTNAVFKGSTYNITEPTGRIILTGKINSETSVINISSLANGIYFLDLIIDACLPDRQGEKIVRKIVKE